MNKGFPLKNIIICVFMLTIFHSILFAADIFMSGQNETRYARGEQPEQSNESGYGYLENYLEINADIEDFLLYLRQGYRLPSEFGRSLVGLNAFDKKFIEYRKSSLTLHAGDFYRTWGNGLLFGNIEQLELDKDSGLEGILVEGYTSNFEAASFRGVESDSTGEFHEAAEGIYLSYSIPQIQSFEDATIRIGGSLIRLDEGIRHPVITRTGAEFELNYEIIDLYSVFTLDKLKRDTDKYYHGFYSSASISGFGWGFLTEYVNYKLFTYSDDPALQYPPTGLPETTLNLLDRHPRTMRYFNNTGFQFQFNFSLDEWNTAANYTLSSETNDGELMPILKEQYSPFRSASIIVDHKTAKGNRSVIKTGWNENVEYTGENSEWIRSYAFGGLYEHRIKGDLTITSDFETMLVKDVNRVEQYWDEYGSVALTWAPYFIFTVSLERSEDPREIGGMKWPEGIIGGKAIAWPGTELVVDILDNTQAKVFYGYERGGLRCSGGTCRWVNPFNGVKAYLTVNF